ncbi:putative proline-specific permease protein [Phaeoacremonium minimum UCRPA7]|uniref:Putative proline-specific permease protein n=1 Tax=Phaeoacremonium minimum (strain UCR-PA7) TaxID=1286976 RepID=R8BNX9_PHAM7|nr:putative proline-specific permease protein [Phaeoacremonium minimum UCRPA7]EOO01039.1 putative proline-specific permease protein [Phaeoacremonium minimum UCRPA7]
MTGESIQDRDIEGQGLDHGEDKIGTAETKGAEHEQGDVLKTQQETQHIGTLERRLKSRHVQFLALSGAIGTGLFVGSGQVLSLAGPLSTFLCYAITGFNLYCVINSLGEMAAWLPIPGAVPIFAARYVDPALGFTLGWNYWYQFAIGVPIEVTVSVVVLDYWHHSIPQAALITIFFIPMVIVNCFPVRVYGEAEFFFGAIKLTTIVGLILLMFLITVGASPTGEQIGFRYWKHPGPMNEYLKSGALGRFLSFFKVFIQATFSYGGSEMVVVASGETENPRRNIPKAIRRVFWRILIFYVLALFLVGLCVSSKDSKLLNAISSSAPGAAQSPFVIAISNAGIKTLPGIINGVILTSAWSAGNSFFYASTRVLYAAALDGKAPAILKRERFGVPYACAAATTALSCLAYLNVNNRAAEVFFWISNLSAVSTLIVWASVCVVYLRFHAALKHNGIDRATLPYRAPGQPFLAYFAVCFCLVIAFFNGFDAFFPGKFSAKTFVPPYIDIPIFLCLFLGYKLAKRTKFVKVSEIDIWSGKAEIDRLEPHWQVQAPRNWLERIWFWIA